MIPILYTGDLKNYNLFVARFKKKLKSAIEDGYIGNLVPRKVGDAKDYYDHHLIGWQKQKYDEIISRKCNQWKTLPATTDVSAPNEMIGDQSQEFFYYAWGWVERICHARPEKLSDYIDYFESAFPDIRNTGSRLYHDVKNMFVTHGYDSQVFDKGQLIEATGINVCPYCNRGFVANVITTKGSVRGQLDHFYPKEKYPYLAISRYNLVPCCSYCNSGSGKGTKDPKAEGLVSPYELKNAWGIRFESNIKSGKVLDLDHCAESIVIKAKANGIPDLSMNIETFNLEALYCSHRDYAAEMYFKYCRIKTSGYKKSVRQLFRQVGKGRFVYRRLTMEDWQRIVFGVYSDEKDFGKRPLSKFCMDMLEDFKKKGL